MKYAWLSGTVWHVTTVDTHGMYTSLALDGSDNPYISYYNNAGSDLRIAWLSEATWMDAPVDTAGTVGLYTSLALDSRGDLHISYHAGEGYGDLKYARRSPYQIYLPLILK
jgi:hypothetical protein